jgi:hypothetical protein
MVKAGEVVRGWLNIGLTVMLLVCAAVILVSAFGRWLDTLRRSPEGTAGAAAPP